MMTITTGCRRVILALLGIAASGVAPVAFAQLPDLVDNRIQQRVEESVAGQVAQRVQDTVQQGVETVVSGAVADNVARGVERSLETVNGALDRVTGLVETTLDIRLAGVIDIDVAPRELRLPDNFRAVEQEWVALVAPGQVSQLRAAGVNVLGEVPLQSTGQVMVRATVPESASAGAQQLLRSLGASAADRNHIYDLQRGPQPEAPEPDAPQPDAPAPQSPSGGASIGIIDTAIDTGHRAFKGASIIQQAFSGSSGPAAHGTAVASLLVGQEKAARGMEPSAKLHAASAFYQGQGGATGATTASLVAALDWLAATDVSVINMSLAGPPNDVLKSMIDTVSAKGVVIVAAVGNAGPAARPLYPAAYDNVLGVTAVDGKDKVYRWANQGPQVDLAAAGVNAHVAKAGGGYTSDSGTSFAAPVVTAIIARLIAGGADPASAAKRVLASARDLGAPGRDDVYGQGVVVLVND